MHCLQYPKYQSLKANFDFQKLFSFVICECELGCFNQFNATEITLRYKLSNCNSSQELLPFCKFIRSNFHVIVSSQISKNPTHGLTLCWPDGTNGWVFILFLFILKTQTSKESRLQGNPLAINIEEWLYTVPLQRRGCD